MTNAELIQATRNEIERLKDEYTEIAIDSHYGTVNANHVVADLEQLLSFLSTLESEKPMNPEEAMKELDEKIALVKQRGTWDGVDVDKYMDEVRGREPEKPTQEGLEEEIREYMSNEDNNPFDWDWRDKRDCARHFARWGAEHLKK